jgi:hypothetical protein
VTEQYGCVAKISRAARTESLACLKRRLQLFEDWQKMGLFRGDKNKSVCALETSVWGMLKSGLKAGEGTGTTNYMETPTFLCL